MAVCSLLNKIHCQCHLWIGLHRLFAFIHSVYHVSFTRIRFILNIAQLGNFTKHVSFILIFKNLAGSRTREKALYFSPSFSVNTGLIVIRTKYMSRNVVKIRRTREKPDFITCHILTVMCFSLADSLAEHKKLLSGCIRKHHFFRISGNFQYTANIKCHRIDNSFWLFNDSETHAHTQIKRNRALRNALYFSFDRIICVLLSSRSAKTFHPLFLLPTSLWFTLCLYISRDYRYESSIRKYLLK